MSKPHKAVLSPPVHVFDCEQEKEEESFGDKMYMHLYEVNQELVEALEEVVRISDRDHEAWFKARAALAKAKGESNE